MKILQLLFKNVRNNSFFKQTWKESKSIVDSIFGCSSKKNTINRNFINDFAEFLEKKNGMSKGGAIAEDTEEMILPILENSSPKTMNLLHSTIKKMDLEISDGIPFELLEQEARSIKFKKAKSIEEATQYAKEQLGINRFEVPDLETANQINYSLTKAFNKTEGAIKGFDEVEYVALGKNSKGLDPNRCPAETRAVFKNQKVKKTILRINKTFFENIDKSINDTLTMLEGHGQISKNKLGNDVIRLVADYRYSNTLNRYYRLYKQGKLTQKAKVDFDNLLHNAMEEERYVLGNKTSTCDIIKEYLGVDISHLSGKEYYKKAKQYLLELQNNHNIIACARENPLKQKGAVGLDEYVLHEQGHSDCYKRMAYDKLKNPHKFNDEEYDAARKVSEYATYDSSEFLQETFAGIMSGDKYSAPTMRLYFKNGGIYT